MEVVDPVPICLPHSTQKTFPPRIVTAWIGNSPIQWSLGQPHSQRPVETWVWSLIIILCRLGHRAADLGDGQLKRREDLRVAGLA